MVPGAEEVWNAHGGQETRNVGHLVSLCEAKLLRDGMVFGESQFT